MELEPEHHSHTTAPLSPPFIEEQCAQSKISELKAEKQKYYLQDGKNLVEENHDAKKQQYMTCVIDKNYCLSYWTSAVYCYLPWNEIFYNSKMD